MEDVEDDEIDFAYHVVGLYNLVKGLPRDNMGQIDYKHLSNVEYQAVSYLSLEIDDMRSRMRG